MPEDTQIEETILEQILDEMFTKLEASANFDPVVIQMLRQLASKGDLKKPAQVAKAIQAHAEVRP
jgi:hypothetical protein